jgi:hypothetical protein
MQKDQSLFKWLPGELPGEWPFIGITLEQSEEGHGLPSFFTKDFWVNSLEPW